MNRRLRTLTIAAFGAGLVGSGAGQAGAAPAPTPPGAVAGHPRATPHPAQHLTPAQRARRDAQRLRAQATRLQAFADTTDADALGAARSDALARLRQATAEREAAVRAAQRQPGSTDTSPVERPTTPGGDRAVAAARAAERAAAAAFARANHRWHVAVKADRAAYLADRAADRAEARLVRRPGTTTR